MRENWKIRNETTERSIVSILPYNITLDSNEEVLLLLSHQYKSTRGRDFFNREIFKKPKSEIRFTSTYLNMTVQFFHTIYLNFSYIYECVYQPNKSKTSIV